MCDWKSQWASNFIGNSAYDGGGVCAHNYAAVAISGISNFTGNSAEIFGGGVYAFRHSRVAINGTSDFMGNFGNFSTIRCQLTPHSLFQRKLLVITCY